MSCSADCAFWCRSALDLMLTGGTLWLACSSEHPPFITWPHKSNNWPTPLQVWYALQSKSCTDRSSTRKCCMWLHLHSCSLPHLCCQCALSCCDAVQCVCTSHSAPTFIWCLSCSACWNPWVVEYRLSSIIGLSVVSTAFVSANAHYVMSLAVRRGSVCVSAGRGL